MTEGADVTTRAPEQGDSTAADAPDTGSDGSGTRSDRSGARQDSSGSRPDGADARAGDADERPRQGRRPQRRAGDAGTGGTPTRRRGGTRALNARRAAQIAAAEVLELTGRQPENVISVARDEDGWKVGIEVVELHRIPDTADILAVYEVRLDARGELSSCSRERRYHRASTEEG